MTCGRPIHSGWARLLMVPDHKQSSSGLQETEQTTNIACKLYRSRIRWNDVIASDVNDSLDGRHDSTSSFQAALNIDTQIATTLVTQISRRHGNTATITVEIQRNTCMTITRMWNPNITVGDTISTASDISSLKGCQSCSPVRCPRHSSATPLAGQGVLFGSCQRFQAHRR